MAKYKEGEKSKGICKTCRKLVNTTFVSKDFYLEISKKTVSDVMQAVCDECGATVSISHQSLPKIRKVLKDK